MLLALGVQPTTNGGRLQNTASPEYVVNMFKCQYNIDGPDENGKDNIGPHLVVDQLTR